MKTLLMAVAIASLFASCKSKANKELEGTASSVTVIDSSQIRNLPTGAKRIVVVETQNADGSKTTTTTTDINTKTSSASKANTAPVVTAAPVATTVAEKKGWSSRAKGAAIGGVGGAAVGAVVSKNKVAGGVLGGAIGAGGGYIIGNEIDRKKAKQ